MTAEIDIAHQIQRVLDSALETAEKNFAAGVKPAYKISGRMRTAIEDLSAKSEKASTGFTNVMTSVSIKVAQPKIDVRYHQVQIQDQTKRPAGFNFRSISEKTVFPWLSKNEFNGAKSGWQTRTFERPKPYSMQYDENIGDIKDSFLTIYDELEAQRTSATESLKLLVYLQVQFRSLKQIKIAEPKAKDISLITGMLREHFFGAYKSKGASRLPVLAFHAIYSVLIREMRRFDGKQLRPLQEHSAADSQTGAVGDVEVVDSAGEVFEALEIKHGIEITTKVLNDVKRKLMDRKVDRYYVLTTHANCRPDGLANMLTQIQSRLGCQVIVNGVLPSLGYYLRLLADPSSFFPAYAALLKVDKAIAFEHREAWNKIGTGS